MKRKSNARIKVARVRRVVAPELQELMAAQDQRPMMAELYRRAEARLRERQRRAKSVPSQPKDLPDSRRLVHELQVHQLELEMQNTELHDARDRLEILLEKYADLYDFAPVGYFSLDAQGRILEVNLTGAAMLGVERSRLLTQRLAAFLTPASQLTFPAFLKRVFDGPGKQAGEAMVRKERGVPFWAHFHGVCALSASGPGKWCRLAVSDFTSVKQAEEAQRRAASLSIVNAELRHEIVRRHTVEKALRRSEQDQRRLLDQSREMQERLRHLSHRILQTQEDERKRISRELHDEITQILVGISVHLEGLIRQATIDPARLKQKIVRTQRMVEKSVQIVHQFARELRPTALDDLGLVAALHSFTKDFAKRTGVRVSLTTYADLEKLSMLRRTVCYRVIHSALTNVAQHAEASRVTVSIHKVADAVHLEITDNGKAFDVEKVLHAKGNKHLGLLGMRERVEMVGGVLSIESTPRRGTRIRVQIPFSQSRRGGGGRVPSAKTAF
jgi:PAS domain S-box-containing protein